MNYAERLSTVPAKITNDPIWKLEIYRLALFAGDIGWHDVLALSKTKLMWSVADQLHRSLDSISANLTEGYSRSKGLDHRFLEFALGSARESRDWYYKSRHVLPEEVVKHRMELLTQIISMLVPMISHQRKHAIREQQADYDSLPQPSDVIIDSVISFP
ncbi:MAG TPA: four helix bundle protein [Anaerolineales bacterium]|nr:four helix bundle protein [Anaerolineales bacterium]